MTFRFTRKLLAYEKNISVDTMTVVLHNIQALFIMSFILSVSLKGLQRLTHP